MWSVSCPYSFDRTENLLKKKKKKDLERGRNTLQAFQTSPAVQIFLGPFLAVTRRGVVAWTSPSLGAVPPLGHLGALGRREGMELWLCEVQGGTRG